MKAWATACVCIVGFLATPALAAWPSFTGPTNISNDYDRLAVDPHMAIDPSGYAHVIYMDFDFDSTGHTYYVNNVGGTWSTPTTLFTTNGKGSGCRLAITGGYVHAFYGKGDLYYRNKPLSGGSWSSPYEVAVNPDGGFINGVAVDGSGGIYFLWTHLFDDSAPMRSAIYGRYRDAGTGNWGSTEMIVGTNDEHKWPQNGNVFVDGNNPNLLWVTYDWSGATRYKLRTTPSGSWSPGGDGTVLETAGGDHKLYWNPIANEMAMLYIYDVDGDAEQLWLEAYVKFSYNGGASWGAPINVSNRVNLDRKHQGWYDDDGNFHVVWESFGPNENARIYYRARIAGAWTPKEDISGGMGSGPSAEAVQAVGNTLHVVYGAATGTADEFEIFYRSSDISAFNHNLGTLAGTVRDQHGDPVAGAQVHAATAGAVTSQANGTYSLPLYSSTFDVTAGKEFYDSDTATGLTITQGNTTNHDFVITAEPPDPVWLFNVSPANELNALWWYNPSSGNYYATKILYRTDTYPTGPEDPSATLLVDHVAAAGAGVSYTHSGLTNGVTYYYAAYTRDNQTNLHYSTAVYAEGTPYPAPKANLLLNPGMDTFTGGVADNWTGYVINDPNTAIGFSANATQYVINQPSQQISGIDSLNLPSSGLSGAGFYQLVYGLTPGKVYQFGGFQDIYVSNYNAEANRYLLNFGINTEGNTDPGALQTDGTIGQCQWMEPEQTMWSDEGGSPALFGGFHRSWASYPATGSTASVWSGLTIDNPRRRDDATTYFLADNHYLFEWDFPANAGLVNADFEGNIIDLQNLNTRGDSDKVPEGWIPAGGATGDWNEIGGSSPYTGVGGAMIFNRRGMVNGGLMQKIACTPGMTQTFTAWAIASGNEHTNAMVGIDPKGIGDITSPDIIWTGTESATWTQISVSAVAQTNEIVVFIRAWHDPDVDGGGSSGYHWASFDDCTWGQSSGPAAGSITGTITDRCGQAVDGATVYTDFGGFSTTSGIDGSYTLSGVYEGFYNVHAQKTGYALGTVEDLQVVSAMQATADVMMPDQYNGTLTGMVIDDCGDPLPGVLVQTDQSCFSAITGADGTYVIENVTTGDYGVIASADGFLTEIQNGVSVPSQGTAEVNFTLYPAEFGSITGYVRSAGGVPVSGVEVWTSSRCHSTITAGDGSYSLTGVKGGDITVKVYKSGYWPIESAPVEISDDVATQVDFFMFTSTAVEKIYNGGFEAGFSHFWGGDYPLGWGALWRQPFPNDDLNPWGATSSSGHGMVVRIKEVVYDWEAGVRQEVSGLTPGAPYTLSGQAYQYATGTTAWLAEGTNGGVEPPYISEAVQFPNYPNSWQSQSLSGIVPESGLLTVNLWTYRQTGTQEECLFDNASLLVQEPNDSGLMVLAVWPTSLSPKAYEGLNAESQSFVIQRLGEGTMNYNIGVAYGPGGSGWLSVSPTSGSSSGEQDGISVTYNTVGLAVGTYTATISIAAGGAANGAETIAVTLTVEEAPLNVPDFNGDNDVDMFDFAVLQACYSGQGVSTPVGCTDADLDKDDDVDQYDMARFALCASAAGVPYDENCADLPITALPPDYARLPDPANLSTEVPLDALLSWTPGTGADSHDVYFGTTNPPSYVTNQSSAIYDPGTLSNNATYYWRIDERNSTGVTTGTVWSFTTEVGDPVTNLWPTSYELANLNIGSVYYVDRTYVIDTMPSYLQGQLGIRTANNDKYTSTSPQITFDLNVEADVYVIYDNRGTPYGGGTPPYWLNPSYTSWVYTGDYCEMDEAASPMRIYKQTFPVGQVQLGGNLASGASGADGMYWVMIVPTGS